MWQAYAALVKDDRPNTLYDVEIVIINFLKAATSLVGIAVLAMFIVGAFQYLLAGSNQEAAQKARGTFTYAFGGAAALIILWLIFLFLREFTGINLLQFKVCIFEDEFCLLR